jgi:hypothetical protein
MPRWFCSSPASRPNPKLSGGRRYASGDAHGFNPNQYSSLVTDGALVVDFGLTRYAAAPTVAEAPGESVGERE